MNQHILDYYLSIIHRAAKVAGKYACGTVYFDTMWRIAAKYAHKFNDEFKTIKGVN